MGKQRGSVQAKVLLCTIIAVVFGLCAISSQVYARHFNKLRYVPAMTECTAAAANTTTSTGIPACSPLQPLSNCATDPNNALKLGYKGAVYMDIRPRGRRITHNRNQTDLVARFIVKDIRRCDGSKLDGVDLRAVTALRMTTEDSTCGGFCTALDFSFPYKIPMQGGRGKLREMSTNPDVIIPLGLTPIPTTRDWHAQILSLNLVDLAGNDFLVPGLMASKPGDAQVELPKKGASYYEVKPIMAFPKCLPGNATYTSADGFQSCQGVPMSNCATDPNTALHFGLPAKPEKGGSLRGLWQMRLPRGSEGRGRGSLRFLRTCSDEPYNGPLKEEFDLRVTYFGPACGGQPCTVVDVHPVMDLVARKGFAKFSVQLGALLQAANLPPLSASAPVSVEVLGIRALDSAGHVFGVLPGMHVSCREVTGFCFGV